MDGGRLLCRIDVEFGRKRLELEQEQGGSCGVIEDTPCNLRVLCPYYDLTL